MGPFTECNLIGAIVFLMKNWILLIVDAKNAFNEINQIGMLWTVHHLWLYVACFVFNCYCHWSSLVLCNRNRTASILNSREGVMQGYPLAMVDYGLWVLLKTKNLKAAHPDVMQPRYTDDAGALGTEEERHFRR